MKKVFRRRSPAMMEQSDPNIMTLIDRMQQQLVSLERKIDTLINRPSERNFEEKRFSKPFHRFDNSSRNDRGRENSNFRERSYTKVICAECNKECEVPFKPSGDRPVYCKDCFSKRKNDNSFQGRRDNKPREGGFIQEHRQSTENVKPGRKKPVSRRRKERT